VTRTRRGLFAPVLVPLPMLAICWACHLGGFDPTREFIVGLSLMTVGASAFVLAAMVGGKS
jgi:hypothetical protein